MTQNPLVANVTLDGDVFQKCRALGEFLEQYKSPVKAASLPPIQHASLSSTLATLVIELAAVLEAHLTQAATRDVHVGLALQAAAQRLGLGETGRDGDAGDYFLIAAENLMSAVRGQAPVVEFRSASIAAALDAFNAEMAGQAGPNGPSPGIVAP